MPTAPRKPCAMSGCGELIARSKRYCKRHEPEARAYEPLSTRSGAANKRLSARRRGYTRRWERLSAYIRQQHPVCECCEKRFSKVVDHIIPKAHGGLDLEVSCWALCKKCHDVKTAMFDGGGGRKVSRIYCGKHAHNAQHMYLLRKYLKDEICASDS